MSNSDNLDDILAQEDHVNDELISLYAENKSIYDITSELIKRLENKEYFNSLDAVLELSLLPTVIPNDFIRVDPDQEFVEKGLPKLTEINDETKPKLWHFFFTVTVELMAQQKGSSILIEEEIEFPFTLEEFIVVADQWIHSRVAKILILNTDEGSSSSVVDKISTDTLADIEKKFEETKGELENEYSEEDLEFFNTTIKDNLASDLELLKERFINLPVSTQLVSGPPTCLELIEFYPICLAYVYVNDSLRTNLDLSLLVRIIHASKKASLTLLSDFSEFTTPANEDSLLGYISLIDGVNWYTDGNELFNVLRSSGESDESFDS
ncbi:MAG: hypothetical protein M0R77_00030 [Gammaproteobacteria bacterium]|nr:hypothetical protein [Acholeplasmataceae bacterium]MCK9528941.1 hypothetical protein [Gammaproteobacteria bacterium]